MPTVYSRWNAHDDSWEKMIATKPIRCAWGTGGIGIFAHKYVRAWGTGREEQKQESIFPKKNLWWKRFLLPAMWFWYHIFVLFILRFFYWSSRLMPVNLLTIFNKKLCFYIYNEIYMLMLWANCLILYHDVAPLFHEPTKDWLFIFNLPCHTHILMEISTAHYFSDLLFI